MEQSDTSLTIPSSNLVVPSFRVVVYTRVSTKEQGEEEKISIPDQVAWAENLSKEKGWDFKGIYTDEIEGDVEFDKRPDGIRLLQDAQFGLFNLVLVYHSSRLARETWVGMKTISILGRLRIQVFIRNAQIEPIPPEKYVYGTNIAAEYLHAFSFVGDKQENIARSERVTSGWKNLAQRKILTFAPHEYDKIPKFEIRSDGRQVYTWQFEPNPVKSAIAVRYFKEYDNGKSLRAICKGLNLDKIPSPTGKLGLGSWTPATLKNKLSDPAFIGKVRWGRKLGSKYRQGRSMTGKQKRVFTTPDQWILADAENVTKPIIEKAVFLRVQERLKQRGKKAGRQLSTTSPLPGLVWCGECNTRAYCKTRKIIKNGHIYIRSDFIDQTYFKSGDCRRHLMSAQKLEFLILSKLQSRLNELKDTDVDKQLQIQESESRASLISSLNQIEKQLKTCGKKDGRLIELYLNGSIEKEEFDKQKVKLDTDKKVLIEEKSRIQSLLNDQKKQREAIKTLKKLLEMFEKVTDPMVKKEMIHRIIDKVVIYQDRVEVIYKYCTEGTEWLNVNPHPCGYLGDPKKHCRCLPGQINQYKKRISGPIIDRIDLHVDLPPVRIEKLTGETKSESSKEVKKRVQQARNLQTKRYKKTKLVCNGDLNAKDIKEIITLNDDCLKLLRQAAAAMNLSARSYYRTIKVARTIADLSLEKEIVVSHIAEALQYRPREED